MIINNNYYYFAVNGDHKYFNEKGECEAFIRKFGLTARRMEFSFKDVNDDEIPQNWLKVFYTKKNK